MHDIYIYIYICMYEYVSLYVFFLVSFYFSRETSPTRELYGDSEKSLMEFSPQSKKKKPFSPTNPCQITSAADSKTPSAKELEEFFAAEEKYQQQRFAEK